MVAVRLHLSILVLLFSGAIAAAQTRAPLPGSPENSAQELGSIRGRVVLPGGENISQAVKVTLKSWRGAETFIYSDAQGMFEIPGLAPGEYILEVEPDHQPDYEPTTARVRVERRTPAVVTINLKWKATEAGPAKEPGAVISATELSQKVPGAAEKEYERGLKAANAGRAEQAVAHLRKAVAVFPDYLRARNDLGTQLLALGRLDEAAAEFREAIRIDPKAFNPQLNLGITLVEQRDHAAALAALDRALALDARSPTAHLFAGLACAELADPERAARELRTAYDLGGEKFSVALFHLGQLHAREGAVAEARAALETYVRVSPDAPRAAEARRLLGLLRP